jgi:hypothetical protein
MVKNTGWNTNVVERKGSGGKEAAEVNYGEVLHVRISP